MGMQCHARVLANRFSSAGGGVNNYQSSINFHLCTCCRCLRVVEFDVQFISALLQQLDTATIDIMSNSALDNASLTERSIRKSLRCNAGTCEQFNNYDPTPTHQK